MSPDELSEESILDGLVAHGYLQVQYQFGIKAVSLTSQGIWAAAVLYNMLPPAGKAAMPTVEFTRLGTAQAPKRERRRAR